MPFYKGISWHAYLIVVKKGLRGSFYKSFKKLAVRLTVQNLLLTPVFFAIWKRVMRVSSHRSTPLRPIPRVNQASKILTFSRYDHQILWILSINVVSAAELFFHVDLFGLCILYWNEMQQKPIASVSTTWRCLCFI